MIFYVNSSGYTEARVLPGVYFFAASALMTILAYGWANAEPPSARRRKRPAKAGGPQISIARSPRPPRQKAA
jgi:paraquat-inducible protein A